MAARVEGYRGNGKDYGKLSTVHFDCKFNLTFLIVAERRKTGITSLMWGQGQEGHLEVDRAMVVAGIEEVLVAGQVLAVAEVPEWYKNSG